MRAGRRGEVLLAAGAVAAVLLLSAMAEGLLRRLDPGYFGRQRDNAVDRLHDYSEIYGWAPRPGARAVENGALTEINAAGYRGPVVSARPGDRRRVVLVGDSTAFGYGVRDEETWARRLERRTGVEAVNLGVEGFGPDQALLRLEREGLALRPDEVLLSFCLANDFADAALPVFLYDGLHPKPYFTLEGGELRLHDGHLRLTRRERLGLWLAERSQLYARAAALLSRARPYKPWRVRYARAVADGPRAAELAGKLVLRMRASAATHGARFTVLLQTSKESYNRSLDLADLLRERLRQARVDLLDLCEVHRAAGRRFSEFAFDNTGHLSPAGHAAVAEAIRDYWQRRERP